MSQVRLAACFFLIKVYSYRKWFALLQQDGLPDEVVC